MKPGRKTNLEESMANKPTRIEAAAAIDIGGREAQEDRVICMVTRNGTRALLVAIDGMGGHVNGAKAASTAQRHLARLGGKTVDSKAVRAALTAANEEIRVGGCVLTGFWIDLKVNKIVSCHIGDSRGWWQLEQLNNRMGPLVQVTEDQTPLANHHKQLNEIEIMQAPGNNYVSNALGRAQQREPPTINVSPVRPGRTVLLLTSDGYHDFVPSFMSEFVMKGMWGRRGPETIARIMELAALFYRDGVATRMNPVFLRKVKEIMERAARGNNSPGQVADDLVELSLLHQMMRTMEAERGQRPKFDNVSVVVAKIT